jgi:hypothetical protein
MSGPETGRDLAVAIATGTEIVVFQLLVFYCTFRILQYRSALHIVQVSRSSSPLTSIKKLDTRITTRDTNKY